MLIALAAFSVSTVYPVSREVAQGLMTMTTAMPAVIVTYFASEKGFKPQGPWATGIVAAAGVGFLCGYQWFMKTTPEYCIARANDLFMNLENHLTITYKNRNVYSLKEFIKPYIYGVYPLIKADEELQSLKEKFDAIYVLLAQVRKPSGNASIAILEKADTITLALQVLQEPFDNLMMSLKHDPLYIQQCQAYHAQAIATASGLQAEAQASNAHANWLNALANVIRTIRGK